MIGSDTDFKILLKCQLLKGQRDGVIQQAYQGYSDLVWRGSAAYTTKPIPLFGGNLAEIGHIFGEKITTFVIKKPEYKMLPMFRNFSSQNRPMFRNFSSQNQPMFRNFSSQNRPILGIFLKKKDQTHVQDISTHKIGPMLRVYEEFFLNLFDRVEQHISIYL